MNEPSEYLPYERCPKCDHCFVSEHETKPARHEVLATLRQKLAIAMEALSAVDSQAVCGGMDGPDGDYEMIEHCEEIATTALRRIEELEKQP